MGIEAALQQPPAIVARAENRADWMKLPGIEEFAARLKQAVQNAREKSAVGRLISWEVIRQCYEYGNRADVRARVAAMNHLPDGSRKNGRPYAGHRLAMEAIAAKCGVHFRTVAKWQESFNEVVNSGQLKPNELNALGAFNPLQVADRLDEIEARIAEKAAKASQAEERERDAPATEGPLPPETYGERLAQSLLHRARLDEAVNPAVVRGLLKALCPVLERHGYTVMLHRRSST